MVFGLIPVHVPRVAVGKAGVGADGGLAAEVGGKLCVVWGCGALCVDGVEVGGVFESDVPAVDAVVFGPTTVADGSVVIADVELAAWWFPLQAVSNASAKTRHITPNAIDFLYSMRDRVPLPLA